MVDDPVSRDPLQTWLRALRDVRWGVGFSKPRGTTLVDMNESFAAMHGYTRDELLGRPISDLVPEDDRQRVDAVIARIDFEEHLVYERHALRKDGTRFPVLVSTTAIRDDSGAVRFRAAHVLDLSAIRESEAAFRFARFAMDRTADAVYLVNCATNAITYANAAASTLMGFSPEELVGMPIERIDPMRVFDAPLASGTGGTAVIEGAHFTKDRTRILVEIVTTRIQVEGERYWCIMARDISQRLRTDNARRFTQFAIDTALDAAYWLDDTGKVIYANDTACESLGYERGALVGVSVKSFIPRYEQVEWTTTFERIRQVKHAQFESVHRRKDGSTFPVEISANSIEVDGRAYLCGYARDITERRKMLNELDTSRARLALLNRIAAGIRSGMSVGDVLEYVVEQVSLRFRDFGVAYGLLGDGKLVISAFRGPPELDVGNAFDFSPAERLVAALERREPVVVRDRGSDARLTPIDRGLAPSVRALVLVPIPHDDDAIGVLSFNRDAAYEWSEHEVRTLQEVGAYLAILIKEARTLEQRQRAVTEIEAANERLRREIAERTKVELEIRELNRTLESRVEQRTRELVATNKELEALVYSVSHDLRAPVRAMGGFSKIVLDEHGAALDQQARSDLERIGRAARRMELMIDDLLNLARVSKRRLEAQAVDLSETARAVLEDLRAAAPERRVNASIAGGIEVHGDPGMLTILLENLLGNAWKFTRRTADAYVEFGRDETDRGAVYYVRDNGAGFDMRYASKLYVPFQRLHSADQFEGTGVGLATVERIVRRHGGTIWAESAEGRGATFFFTLGEVTAN